LAIGKTPKAFFMLHDVIPIENPEFVLPRARHFHRQMIRSAATYAAAVIDEARLGLLVQGLTRPNGDFRSCAGYVASGTVELSDQVSIARTGQNTRVARIVSLDGDRDRADTGSSITLTLADQLDVAGGEHDRSSRCATKNTFLVRAGLAATRTPFEDCPAGVAEATELTVANLELKGLGDAAGRTTRARPVPTSPPPTKSVAMPISTSGSGPIDPRRCWGRCPFSPGSAAISAGYPPLGDDRGCAKPYRAIWIHLRYRKPRPISQEPGQPRPAAQGKQRFRSR